MGLILGNKFLSGLLYFILGVVITLVLVFSIGKDKVGNILRKYIDKGKRFINNLINNIPILLILVVFYNILIRFNYSKEMLPDIIGIVLSIIIINFILDEKEYNKKKDLKQLLNIKINEIYNISDKMILKYINFHNYNIEDINESLLKNILNKSDLLKKDIEHKFIDNEGKVESILVPKIDYPYFIGKELKPIIKELTSNYALYLDHIQMEYIIKIDEMLNKRLFNSRVSLIEGIETVDLQIYYDALANSLSDLIKILFELKNKC